MIFDTIIAYTQFSGDQGTEEKRGHEHSFESVHRRFTDNHYGKTPRNVGDLLTAISLIPPILSKFIYIIPFP